ncbi:MAG: hypothetical protein HY833_03075 [Candidatus Aenigmarchaeota archaeon]|nr:hypothetical protein [Candidatus Aenigmarchaeota archaeon]
MRNYTVPSPYYNDVGSGNFCSLVGSSYSSIISDKETPLRLSLIFERTDYSPSCFGMVSTLETEREIVITRRSNEMGCFRNQLGCFSGALPFGTSNVEKWAENRVRRESNHGPYMELAGICDDNVTGCSVLSYRGSVDVLENLPRNLYDERGVLKYSEIFKVEKRDLPKFIEDNKRDLVSTLDPLLSYVAMMEKGKGSLKSFVRKMNAEKLRTRK